jgi:hypothetical protein
LQNNDLKPWYIDMLEALGGCLKSILIIALIIAAVSWGCSIHWLLGIVIFAIMILLFGG